MVLGYVFGHQDDVSQRDEVLKVPADLLHLDGHRQVGLPLLDDGDHALDVLQISSFKVDPVVVVEVDEVEVLGTELGKVLVGVDDRPGGRGGVDDHTGVRAEAVLVSGAVLVIDAMVPKVFFDCGKLEGVVGEGAKVLAGLAELLEDGAAVGGVAAAGVVLIQAALVSVLQGEGLDHVDDVQADEADTQYAFGRHVDVKNLFFAAYVILRQ